MTSRTRRIYIQMISFVAASLFLTACSVNGNSFPQIANSPPFDYADGDELRSRMHQLAWELQQLDLTLATQVDNSPTLRQEVVDNLSNIERIAGYLQSGDLSSRHTFLQNGMDRFLADVGKARIDATLGTPRYYMAGRISGSCVNCHNANR